MEGIIFDVDGTLWDSTEVVAESWNRAVREHSDIKKEITARELMQLFGRPVEEIVANVFPMLSKSEQDALGRYCLEYENKDVAVKQCVIYEGMPEVIRELSARYKLFIVSNCMSGYIEAFLENTKLQKYITDFTCPGETGKSKGENIQIIMRRNHIKKAVYVGDTQGDLSASRYAQIPMIYASYGFGDIKEEICSIRDIKELLVYNYDQCE